MNEPELQGLDAIAEEFCERFAAGENPSLEEFAARYPNFSAEILELFPTLELIASVLPDEKLPTSPLALPNCLENETIEDFRMIRELGRGGMGIVYEAEQQSLGRRVALKLLPMTRSLGSKRKERFHREAMAAGRLHHTNIVPVFGIGDSDDLAFLIMQLIPGVSLDKVIPELRKASQLQSLFQHVEIADLFQPSDEDCGLDNQNTLDDYHSADIPIGDDYWREIAAIGQQAADALQYACDQGVWHRDIKPGNLILDTDHRTWVSDFGLAKILDSDEITKSNDVMGTIKYMAPERLYGEYSAKSDIYSLGTTLYELATLRPAFGSTKPATIARKGLLREPPPPLQTLRPSIPRDLRTIIETAMADEPDSRYKSAGELAADLNRFINDEPIKARPESIAGSTIRWARRNPMLAGTLAALAICLMAVAIISTRSAQHFRILNAELTQSNEDLESANLSATRQQNLSQQRETRLLFQRGRELAEQGKTAEGLLTMVESLQQCPESMPDYVRTIRANISAWSELVPEILEMNPDPFHKFRDIDYSVGGPLGDFFLFTDKTIRRIDAQSGQQIGPAIELDSLAFSSAVNPQGTLVAVTTRTNQNRLLIFDLANVAQPPIERVVDESLVLEFPYWHPNGKSVALRTQFNKSFVVWDDFHSAEHEIFTCQPKMEPQVLERLAQFMPGGAQSKILDYERKRTMRDERMRLDDHHATTRILYVVTGNQLRLQLPHAMRVIPSVDGQQIQCTHFRIRDFKSSSRLPPSAVSSMNEIGNSKYWNLSTAAYSGDGNTAITRDPDILFWGRKDITVPRSAAQLLDTRTGQPIGRPLQHQFDSVRVVAMSADGKTAATGGYKFDESGGAVYLWDAKTGQKRFGPLIHEDYVSALDFSPDGRWLAAGDYSGQVRIWDTFTGEEVRPVIDVGKIVFALAFNDSGQHLAVGSFGDDLVSTNNLSVWNIAEGTATWLPFSNLVDQVRWIPHTNRLLSFNSNSLKLWDLDQPETPIASLDEVEMFCSSVAENKDLIAIGTSIGSVYLMNALTGEVLPNVLDHPSTIYDVDLSPDGNTLAVACKDGGLRIWDLPTFEQLGPPLMQNGILYRTRFLPDGKTVLSTGLDGTTRRWRVPQANDTPSGQLKRLIEIRTGQRLVNSVAMKIQGDDWAQMRDRAIEESMMLDQASSDTTAEGMPALVQVIVPRDLHEARARDAEQDKDWLGAHWHLNRIILSDRQQQLPAEWQLLARRARTWSERSDFDQAEQDYAAATELLPGHAEKLTDWYRHRVVECQRRANWKAALWYLDRILLLDDKDWNSYAARADAHFRLGDFDKQAADKTQALKLSDDPIYRRLYSTEKKPQAKGN